MPDYLNRLLTDGASLSWVQARLKTGLTAEQIYRDEWSESNGHPARLLWCELRPPDFSDSGNAVVFCQTYREQLIYTDSRGWLAYDGMRWEANDHQAFKLAGKLSADMLEDAKQEYFAAVQQQAEVEVAVSEGAQEDDAKEKAKKITKSAKAYLDHAQQLRNERRLKAMLELAKHELAVDPSILDADPDILNTPGGIIHLPTGKLMPHDPKRFCTKITAVSPGTRGAEMWVDCLSTLTQSNDSLIGFLQLVSGMALYGKVYQEAMIFAYGNGKNGKSTIFNALGDSLGDYSGTLEVETLMTGKENRGPDIIELRGKRLIVTGELEEGKRLSVSTLKRICSTDKITAAAKFRQPETFSPSHSIVLYTNYLPRVGSSDDGTWRRIVPIEFKAKIDESSDITNYASVLVREAGPAILTWAIQGAVNFANNGYKLTLSDDVAMSAEAYRDQEDWLQNFLREMCILEPGATVRAGELYQTYKNWSKSAGDYTRRLSDFNTEMERHGFTSKAPKNKKCWIGVKIDYQQQFAALG